MNYKKIILITLVSLILLQIAIAENGEEATTLNSTQTAEIGTGVTGTVQDGVYYITSGTISGDISNKNIIIKTGGSVTISADMKGTLKVEGGTVKLPAPSEKQVKGTGTCTNKACSFTNAETGEGDKKVSGNFDIRSDDTLDVRSGTVGDVPVQNLQNLRFILWRIVGEVNNGEVNGNKIENHALFEYDTRDKEVLLMQPAQMPAGYRVKVSKFTQGTIRGSNIEFQDPQIKSLAHGSVTKKSDTQLVYSSNSRFEDNLGSLYTVKKPTSYITGFDVPEDSEDSYILSDIDPKAKVATLRIKSVAGNDIDAILTPETYKFIDLANIGSNVRIESGTSIVNSYPDGSVSTNSMKDLKFIVRSQTLEGYYFMSNEGAGKCDLACSMALIDVKVAQTERLIEKPIEEIISQLSSTDPMQKRSAMDALREKKITPEMVEALVGALDIEDSQVKIQVIRALRRSKDSKAVEPLLKLFESQDAQIRIASIMALEDFKDPKIIEPVLNALQDPETRLVALDTLASLENDRAKQAIIQTLKDKDQAARLRAVDILVYRLKDSRAIEPLLDIVKNKDENTELRKRAISALSRQDADEKLVEAYSTADDQEIRIEILNRLSSMNHPKTTELILQETGSDAKKLEELAFDDAKENSLRLAAIQALYSIKGRDAKDAVLKAGFQGVIATDLLAKVADKDMITQLTINLKHEDKLIKNNAIDMLTELKDPSSQDALIEALEDKDIRGSAINALIRLDTQKAYEAVFEALNKYYKDPKDYNEYEWRETTLRRIRSPEAVLTQVYLNKDVYRDIPAIENKLEIYYNNQGPKIGTHQVYTLSRLSEEDLTFNRAELENQIQIPGTDPNTEYQFQNIKQRLSPIEIKKVQILTESFQDTSIRQGIGSLIGQDLSEQASFQGVRKDGTQGNIQVNGHQTELGGLVFIDQNKKLNFLPYEPLEAKDNGEYPHSAVWESHVRNSFADFHLHAVTLNMAESRPSGEGGDLSVAANANTDGIVITAKGPGKFHAHYYTPRGDVVFVGEYTY
ncbi:HEAT repeat domain-containing protein [Candidatus Woesearchaeota archaeon]|nr:HEAT repeat domain-containing protein [Candidatus Woesearchaeota archaeon]